MLTAREQAGERTNFEPIAEGVHMCLCTGLIDLGNQANKFKEGTVQPKFMIQWDVTDETYTDGEGNEKVRTQTKEYTNSLHEKAVLRKDLQAWRGKPFSEEELKGFELPSILNTGCQIQFMHEVKGDKTYAKIASIMGLPKGMKMDKSGDILIFDFDDNDTWENYHRLPEWIKKKITEATNFMGSDLEVYVTTGKKTEIKEVPKIKEVGFAKEEVAEPVKKVAKTTEELLEEDDE